MRTEIFVLRWISAPLPFARRCAPPAADRRTAGRRLSGRFLETARSLAIAFVRELTSFERLWQVAERSMSPRLRHAQREDTDSLRKVPYLLAGRASGSLKTGQLVDVKITNNKLLDTIGTAVGCTNGQGGPLDNFGDESREGGLVDPIIA
ncbi:hypothetical protein [Sorangium sp. So ce590]|uniref:hypothetical protein n=1 Tax=unclassified Sorangium TaxID=2621164 RepID=UPI003F600C8C